MGPVGPLAHEDAVEGVEPLAGLLGVEVAGGVHGIDVAGIWGGRWDPPGVSRDAVDLVDYWWHWLSDEVNVLWAAHVVHRTDD